MIQFNLLPDVKLEYIKATRLKRTVVVISFIVAAVSLAGLILLLVTVYGVKPNHLKNLDRDIAASKTELQNIPDLPKILTIQNQLSSLPALHSDKPVASRVFGYVQQLAPQKAGISSLVVNFDDQSMVLSGSATDLAAVNTFVDTLKFTMYTTDANATSSDTKAFSSVVLSQFSISQLSAAGSTANSKPASYSIQLKYVPEIFKSDQNTRLIVPNKVTTRSETEKPSNIFQAPVPGGVE